MIDRRWPEKYNVPGHVRWVGRIYGSGLTHALGWRRPRVYHGVWGGAPFQSLYQPAPSLLGSLPQMPEWYLMIASLATIAAFSAVWRPFRLALPLLAVAIVPPRPHGAAPSGPAPGPAARAPQRRPHSLATARHARAGPTLAGHDIDLDRAPPRARPATQGDGGGAPGRWRVRVARRPARSLGSGGPRRVSRSGPAAAGRRGAPGWPPDAPAPLVARCTGARAAPDARVRAARAQRAARPGVGRHGPARAGRGVLRVAHDRAVQRGHGDRQIGRAHV